ncbi:hypothetical protein PR003_g13147 [Phytophthora rubi]|uniref:Uncharacterized protein n=1 Tax=Phytophthora rubi TaxID=129364 RepID=A0A6A3LHA9_9STRA|nr:hypothetical protein PR002_g13982 [Phytophthora rubi]KAE9025000.1 hypothetical protein PR001_g12536 [Phytophthora rubi]KAE9335177.1 hypothetical protein PR003_g13147 [Phytophthora rubi]
MGRNSASDGDEADAAELLAEVEAELREQRAEEATNMFVGIVYEFKKVHSLKFYHNTLQGCVRAVGAPNPGLIEEFPDFAAAKRARLSKLPSDGDMEEDQE